MVFEPYQDIPWFDGHPQDVIEEKVSDTVYKILQLQKAAQQACIERNNATDGQIFVFDPKYSTGSVDFPTVTLTYTTGDNGGDNGNSNTNNQNNTQNNTNNNQTTAKPNNNFSKDRRCNSYTSSSRNRSCFTWSCSGYCIEKA